MQTQLTVDIIKAILITAIVPIFSYLITKYLDYKITKKLDRLQKDITDIKNELQISTDIKDYINKIEVVSNYCASKIDNENIKMAMVESNRMFVSIISDIIYNGWYDVKYFDLIQNKLNSNFFYCENYLKQTLSDIFCNKFFNEQKLNFIYFLKEFENIILSGTNQKVLKIVDLSINFIRKYNELAKLLQDLENEKL